MRRSYKALILAFITVLLGFLRDYIFVNINWILKTLTVNRPNGAREEFHFFLEWEVGEILILKWVLTFLFFFLFGFLTWLIVKISFQNTEYNRITIYAFLALLGISALLYIPFKLMGNSSDVYAIIRTVMGIAQSFMPLMFLWILFKFMPQNSKDS